MAFSLADVPKDEIRRLLGARALTSGAIAIGSNTAKVKSVATITFIIDGIFYTKTATDDFWALPATVEYIAPGSAAPSATVSSAFGATTETEILTRYFFLGIDVDGAQHTYMSLAPSAAQATQDPTLVPEIPKTVAICGIVKVVVAAGTVFTPGTTALSAAGVTETYYNVSCIPATLP